MIFILLLLLAIILFGLGFAIKWLFILALIALIVAVFSGFTGGWTWRR